MIRFLLDTDHLTLHERGHPPLLGRLMSVPQDSTAISVVTVEEALRGRLAVLSRRLKGDARVRAYGKLLETVRFFTSIRVVPFDRSCEERFEQLRALKLRIGSQDMKIAATALVHNLTVVTRNRRDFEQIEDLSIENWS